MATNNKSSAKTWVVATLLLAVLMSVVLILPKLQNSRRLEVAAEQEAKHTQILEAVVNNTRLQLEETVAEYMTAQELRENKLERARPLLMRWANEVARESDNPDWAMHIADIAPRIDEQVLFSVLGRDGNVLIDGGEVLNLEREDVHLSMGEGGYSIAVGFKEKAIPKEEYIHNGLKAKFMAAQNKPVKVGVYLLDKSEIKLALAPRPSECEALSLSEHSDLEKTKSRGSIESGIIITSTQKVEHNEFKATLVAEAFLSRDLLTRNAKDALPMAILGGVGILIAAMFAYTIWRGLTTSSSPVRQYSARGRPSPISTRMRAGLQSNASPAPAPSMGNTSGQLGVNTLGQPLYAEGAQDDIDSPRGLSIIRLREELGAMSAGPDLSATARSPILRALSKYVRAQKAGQLPNEIKAWGGKLAAQNIMRGGNTNV